MAKKGNMGIYLGIRDAGIKGESGEIYYGGEIESSKVVGGYSKGMRRKEIKEIGRGLAAVGKGDIGNRGYDEYFGAEGIGGMSRKERVGEIGRVGDKIYRRWERERGRLDRRYEHMGEYGEGAREHYGIEGGIRGTARGAGWGTYGLDPGEYGKSWDIIGSDRERRLFGRVMGRSYGKAMEREAERERYMGEIGKMREGGEEGERAMERVVGEGMSKAGEEIFDMVNTMALGLGLAEFGLTGGIRGIVGGVKGVLGKGGIKATEGLMGELAGRGAGVGKGVVEEGAGNIGGKIGKVMGKVMDYTGLAEAAETGYGGMYMRGLGASYVADSERKIVTGDEPGVSDWVWAGMSLVPLAGKVMRDVGVPEAIKGIMGDIREVMGKGNAEREEAIRHYEELKRAVNKGYVGKMTEAEGKINEAAKAYIAEGMDPEVVRSSAYLTEDLKYDEDLMKNSKKNRLVLGKHISGNYGKNSSTNINKIEFVNIAGRSDKEILKVLGDYEKYYGIDLRDIKESLIENKFLIKTNSGTIPLLGTGEMSDFNIKVYSTGEVVVEMPEGLLYCTEWGGKLFNHYVIVEGDPYLVQKKNREYIEKLTGGKVFGSSYNEGTKIGHDYDIMIEADRLGEIEERLKAQLGEGHYRLSRDRSDLVRLVLEPDKSGVSKYGDYGMIDVNLVQSGDRLNSKGERLATGERALELYQMFFPDEFQKSYEEWYRRMAAEDSDFTISEMLDVFRDLKIDKTPAQLIEAAGDFKAKTVMDALDSPKEKHVTRIVDYIKYMDPVVVDEGINRFYNMKSGTYHGAPRFAFDDINENRQLLKAIGFPYDVSESPERMQCVFDWWYGDKMIYGRGLTIDAAALPDDLRSQFTSKKYYSNSNSIDKTTGINTVKGSRFSMYRNKKGHYGRPAPIAASMRLNYTPAEGMGPLDIVQDLRRATGDQYVFTVNDTQSMLRYLDEHRGDYGLDDTTYDFLRGNVLISPDTKSLRDIFTHKLTFNLVNDIPMEQLDNVSRVTMDALESIGIHGLTGEQYQVGRFFMGGEGAFDPAGVSLTWSDDAPFRYHVDYNDPFELPINQHKSIDIDQYDYDYRMQQMSYDLMSRVLPGETKEIIHPYVPHQLSDIYEGLQQEAVTSNTKLNSYEQEIERLNHLIDKSKLMRSDFKDNAFATGVATGVSTPVLGLGIVLGKSSSGVSPSDEMVNKMCEDTGLDDFDLVKMLYKRYYYDWFKNNIYNNSRYEYYMSDDYIREKIEEYAEHMHLVTK